ncbi:MULTISPECIES: hypothetical protein [Micromonospora]|uniref:Leucine rich repeat variant n=2 Tax=Micromonospora tulbaghiae TaxID=479978 RepID=A0ABY0KSA3_9ACTN|nr:hypothetical protein [Micromonospora chalcea]PPA60430.1 hypothetical protein BAW75_01380 [Micromonospora chalcea]SCF01262.1 Leucine rich repeat variant [Micromonospora tulbaghiae]
MAEDEPTPVHLTKVLDGLAENPALPTGLVRRLVRYRRGFGHVAKRADLTPDMIEEVLASGHDWLLRSLALNRQLPNAVRMRLAAHADPAVRAALVVGARGAPREWYERLIDDPDRLVRGHLAERDDVPADLLARLATDPDPPVRATLARWWTQAPGPVRRLLLTDSVDEVRAAACSTYYARLPHPVPPPDLVAGLLADPVTRAGAVRHADLTPELAKKLAGDPDHHVRRQVAEHPQLPSGVRDLLAEDPSANVRVGVFSRRDTPEPVRHRIYTQIQQSDRPLADLLDDELDDTALLQLVEDHMAVAELQHLRLDWVTADPLPHLSSPYICFRRSAARGRTLPADAVIRLLNDDDRGVRTSMATHAPHLVDPATAERIDREFGPDNKTRWRPADVFTFPPQTLRRFATDPDPRMRCLAPRDPDLPVELAGRLATDPDSTVRHEVAGHPNLPVHVRRVLLADSSEWVAHAAAAAATLPVAEMERLLTLAGV